MTDIYRLLDTVANSGVVRLDEWGDHRTRFIVRFFNGFPERRAAGRVVDAIERHPGLMIAASETSVLSPDVVLLVVAETDPITAERFLEDLVEEVE